MASHFEFSYTLSEQEVFDGLQKSGVYKSSGTKALIETIVLAVLCVFFFFSYFSRGDIFSLVMGILSLVVILALNLIPRLDMKKQAEKGQKQVKIRLYQDKFYADTEVGSQPILLDGTSTIKTVGKENPLVTVQIAGGGLLVIPVRSIPQEIRGEVMSLLLQNQ